MPQNTKDSQGGKSKPVQDTPASSAKHSPKGSGDTKTGATTGSRNKGEKKTTP